MNFIKLIIFDKKYKEKFDNLMAGKDIYPTINFKKSSIEFKYW